MKVIYKDDTNEETAFKIHEIEVDKLNIFEGADINNLQVLKSAAGYYIGTLVQADWNPTFWEPNFRDSQKYWATREEAEEAFIKNNYTIKF